jgi:predicted RNA-binding protein associated with RNAse of E/G family
LVYLNQVRNRSGLDSIITTDQSALRDIILKERRIELAFEDKRWHDLVRTDRAITVMNAYGAKVKNNPQEYYYPVGSQPFASSFEVTEDSYLYPIPVTDININPELEQNPGY